MKRLLVKSRDSKYDVIMGRGAWREFRRLRRGHDWSSIIVLAERGTWTRWERKFLADAGLKILGRGAKQPEVIFVHPGESSKALATVGQIAERLLRARADRRSLLVAFGGGVVGDLGGFVASTYMRGIDFIHIPTTIVAQVDSSIGSKNGVDLGDAKNILGTFNPPLAVLSDPQVLSTLSPRAFRSGLYEAAKHALLVGSPLFEILEREFPRASPARAVSLAPVLARVAQVKIDVVSGDEREGGTRRLLNLGHTFGHAIEGATGYRRLMHGEAVGWGLLCAIRLGQRLGVLADGEAERMARLIRLVGLLPPIRDLPARAVIAHTAKDKKSVGGRVHWIVPFGIGDIRVVPDIPSKIAVAAFEDVQKAGGRE